MSTGLRRHRATTADACTLYPLGIQTTPPSAGVFVGVDVLSGMSAWCWDPFAAYAAGMVTNPNVLTLGEPGVRKSTLVKTVLLRMRAVYGDKRYFAILDPKGEYTALARTIGMPVVRLRPGGDQRINPLAGDPADDDVVRRWIEATTALLETCAVQTTATRLSTNDRAVIRGAVTAVGRGGGGSLREVARLLAEPTDVALTAAGMTHARFVASAGVASNLVGELLGGVAVGMFDGESTVDLSFDQPGVVVDLSAVSGNELALPLTMLAVTAWLTELRATAEKPWVQVMDEVWALLAHEASARFLQESYKLGRNFGVANWLIAHRVSDLTAQADSGSAASKIGGGLLADTATRIVLRQNAAEAALASDVFGLNTAETSYLRSLPAGRALWKMAGTQAEYTALVDHRVHVRELPLVDTDMAMRSGT